MEELLDKFVEYLLPQSNVFLYVLLFLSAVIENLFPPIPGDTITGLGAFLVGTGRLDFWIVYAVTTLGSLLGFMIIFTLGRYFGYDFFMRKNYKVFSKKTIDSAMRWSSKYGYIIVLINRFAPGIRAVISLTAGILRLNPLFTGIAALISAAAWNLIFMEIGFSIGSNWDTVKEKLELFLKNYNIAAGAIILLIVIALCVKIFLKRRRGKKSV